MTIFETLDKLQALNKSKLTLSEQKRIGQKNALIITLKSNNKLKYKILLSYDRVVAIYKYDTNYLIAECQKIKNKKAYKSYSMTTTTHINIFIDNVINRQTELKAISNFDKELSIN